MTIGVLLRATKAFLVVASTLLLPPGGHLLLRGPASATVAAFTPIISPRRRSAVERRQRQPLHQQTASTTPTTEKPTPAAAALQQQDDQFQSSSSPSSSSAPPPPPWIMREGLLISSFADGLVRNAAARNQLRHSLIRVLLAEQQRAAESELESSVVFSPCNGPNVSALDRLEGIDRAMEELLSRGAAAAGGNGNDDPLEILRDSGAAPQQQQQQQQQPPFELRLLYIPTALYSPRPGSSSTPGRQRQRTRADGRKRRDAVVQLLKEELMRQQEEDISIAAVTLDLGDGSVRHPVRTTGGVHDAPSSSPLRRRPAGTDAFFPTTGPEALGKWNPHVVYVEGGNTFWLHHCLENGNWREALQALVQRDDTLYCGASAGMIVAGAAMETACWKGWDDPSVVPGRESPDDWRGVPGLDWCGGWAFFPHHVDGEWGETVRQRGAELRKQVRGGVVEVCSLRDDQVCHVDGAAGRIAIL